MMIFRLFTLSWLAIISTPANATIETNGVLDEVAVHFLTVSSSWAGVITNHASWLFWLLGTISLVWTGGNLLLKQADIREFFAEFTRFIITFGFFLWLLRNGPKFAASIIDSLRIIGAQAAGLPRELTPSEPISIAFDIIAKSSEAYSYTSPFDNLAIFIITLLILVCMTVVAANVLLSLISAWVLTYAGIFVLGFGGSKWTSDIAINYFRNVLGLALKLMTMTLMIGVAMSIMDSFYTELSANTSMKELLVIFVVSVVLMLLIHSVPNVVASLIPGSGSATSSGNVSASAMAGAAMATGGMAAGAAMGTLGGASALQAAFKAASNSEMLDSMTGSIGSDSSTTSEDPGTGDTPFAHASGMQMDSSSVIASTAKAGRIAAGTGANLAKGIGDIARNRISQTVGGRVAETIKTQSKQEDI
ncbi:MULTISPECIES: P-type conjugative transfer protein TrbL [Vibrio harveyi group]|uniref:P-type conjugative transfer protein TrbL n=1 Tax=Vibrio harveyi group TaxID=717610 RepID=UPI001B815B7E|nr:MULTISPECIES: P-type conjugative transfer protein TrbL [Vibrio harveyi group]EGQ8495351.1 P-type conjugative transfer protein TrbL [Vibrio alginolyticus]EGR0396375.1 P-type conjugative transfer protein TrbL [Vibrio parahaemolyticus]EJE8154272.1 P-type conjugative transfer protein TrbL [Vibrio alginolyticus]MBE5194974.1 P-type conjugative transfer protein TrbL [Vibrio parahaemolyticus]MBS9975559.1 P-type conjugative transfer protein TrbL [Vibrio alginolyticus]